MFCSGATAKLDKEALESHAPGATLFVWLCGFFLCHSYGLAKQGDLPS
jgi:hypothetical protein